MDTSALDRLKQKLPGNLGPKSKNQYLIIVSAVLRFMWKRGKLKTLPFIPRETVPKKDQDWYLENERDCLLDSIFRNEPEWYLFFYVTMRLGLRSGEVYARSHRQVREPARKLIIDQAVHRGTKDRPAMVIERKNDEAYTLDVSQDVFDAIKWHVRMGFAGREFLFSKDGRLPAASQRSPRAPRTGAAGDRPSFVEPPQDRSALGREPGGDCGHLDQGDPGAAMAPLGSEHAQVRAPRIGGSAPRRRDADAGPAAAFGRQRGVNGKK